MLVDPLGLYAAEGTDSRTSPVGGVYKAFVQRRVPALDSLDRCLPSSSALSGQGKSGDQLPRPDANDVAEAAGAASVAAEDRLRKQASRNGSELRTGRQGKRTEAGGALRKTGEAAAKAARVARVAGSIGATAGVVADIQDRRNSGRGTTSSIARAGVKAGAGVVVGGTVGLACAPAAVGSLGLLGAGCVVAAAGSGMAASWAAGYIYDTFVPW